MMCMYTVLRQYIIGIYIYIDIMCLSITCNLRHLVELNGQRKPRLRLLGFPGKIPWMEGIIILPDVVEVLGAIFQVLGKPRTSAVLYHFRTCRPLEHQLLYHFGGLSKTTSFSLQTFGKTFQLPGGSSQLSTIQLPIPEDGIFECLWEEEMEFCSCYITGGEMGELS